MSPESSCFSGSRGMMVLKIVNFQLNEIKKNRKNEEMPENEFESFNATQLKSQRNWALTRSDSESISVEQCYFTSHSALYIYWNYLSLSE